MMYIEDYFDKTSEKIKNTSKEEFLEILKKAGLKNCELKERDVSNGVKTKRFLTKENKMLKKCINIVVEAYVHDKGTNEIFHKITSKMGDFYNNNKLPTRKYCNKCGIPYTSNKEVGSQCPVSNCGGKLID